MIFISGVMSIIIQKNTLCANKILVICFCPNCVIPPPPQKKKTFIFYLFIYFLERAGATASPAPQLVHQWSGSYKSTSGIRFTHKSYQRKLWHFSKFLHLLFNTSVNEGTFPSVFKFVDVTSILKRGSKNSSERLKVIKDKSAF